MVQRFVKRFGRACCWLVQKSRISTKTGTAASFKEEFGIIEDGEISTGVYASLLKQCGELRSLKRGKRVHDHINGSKHLHNVFLGNLLVEMYGKCASVRNARRVFDGIRQKNVFSWNIMIAAYVQNGHLELALQLLQQMGLEGVEPDLVTFINALGACCSLKSLVGVHELIYTAGFESNLVVATALVNMYGRCGRVDQARRMFDKMAKNVVTWNAMIAAYAQNGHSREALDIYQSLGDVKPDGITFVNILAACANMEALEEGKKIHEHIVAAGLESDVIVVTALITMYSKCGKVEDAKRVFLRMREGNLISWTAMISAYAQNGYNKEALELYQQMTRRGMKPDAITFISVLDVCSSAGDLAKGRRIHSQIIAMGIPLEGDVGATLVNMYSKCGSLVDAREAFDKSRGRGVISWNTMLLAYAQNGHRKEAIEVLGEMALEGIQPNGITLVAILYACSHAGLLEESRVHFKAMIQDHSLVPTAQHYGCMVDLLGRMGRLSEAEELLNRMPFEPSPAQWTSLLGACRVHNDVERGALLAKDASLSQPQNSSPYVLLSNIYSSGSRQKRMQQPGAEESECIEFECSVFH